VEKAASILLQAILNMGAACNGSAEG